VKFLLSPIGIILIVAVLVVLFLPRRAPDVVKKKFGKRPMRAYPDDQAPAPGHAEGASAADQSSSSTPGVPGEPPTDRPRGGRNA
jgi:hypothetical protein